ncbi:WD40-repeat-containing domain protein [Mycena pura]|uniref:WD40-repeat-containing domain protein n=1 Tax=Mycena pura TaxID=153505 RepID=A0AAD6Y9C6_9AGAR|nr:WD40-repeat-containing domain protein [Mycena pura]
MPVEYHLRSKLEGHTGAVVCLSCRDDGKQLASGASDGTKVWDLVTWRQVPVPASSAMRGATTTLLCVKRNDDVTEALVIAQGGYLAGWREDLDKESGTRSFLEVWCHRLREPAEISGLAFDALTNRLAVCNVHGVLQMYTLNSAMSLTERFDLTIPKCVPRALGFGAMQGNERELLVFGLHCGLVVHGNTVPSPSAAWNVGCGIGGVAMDAATGVVCINDPWAGVNLYKLRDREFVKSFSIPIKKTGRTRQVCLGDSCTTIVSGSDHGTVYVYDRRSQQIVAKLHVDPNEWVQTVDVGDVGGVPHVFAAKSREIVGLNSIFVYRKRTNARRFAARVIAALGTLIQVTVLFAALGFLYQNLNLYM